MSLRLYNTRTRTVEPFVPLRGNDARIYVCGLTPSAEAHIGHARSFLFFDVLRRYLTFCGYHVTYVQNVTDVDDRTIRRAHQSGESIERVVAAFYGAFKESMRKLSVSPPDEEPYASRFITEILAMIGGLLERKHAYISKDGVYYRVSTFARYGQLAHRNIDELRAGARVEIDEYKEDPLDFALWKFAKPNEPSWPTRWGAGRPGWHIECSAMSRALLDPQGEGFDIHGGGADLIFPHHENEIAQSEPLMPHPPMANFWVHSGLLLYEGRKMSKSLGNFEPLTNLLERHDPQAIRLLFLQTGYRKVMNFTEDSINAAATVLERLKKAYRELWVEAPESQGDSSMLLPRVSEALDDDMNTAVALAAVLDFANAAHRHAVDARTRAGAFAEYARALELLGIVPNEGWREEPTSTLPPDFLDNLTRTLQTSFDGSAENAIVHVIEMRSKARAAKDWATSDRLRDALLQCGVEVKDSKTGTTWKPL